MHGRISCRATELGRAVAGERIRRETSIVKQKVSCSDSGFATLRKFWAQKIGVGQGHVQVELAALIKLKERWSGDVKDYCKSVNYRKSVAN